MILMNVKLVNMGCFDDFEMNMSYPKKIVGTTLEETLDGFNNFRYKKVNILMGMNASGKTTFGKILMSIFNYIHKRESWSLSKWVANREMEAIVDIDFIPKKNELYNLKINIASINSEDFNDMQDLSEVKIKAEVKRVKLRKLDSYESAKQRLLNAEQIDFGDIPKFGWLFTYPIKEENSRKIRMSNVDNDKFLHVLNNVLKTLDNSIIEVKKSEEIKDVYVITKNNFSEIVLKEGEVIPRDILSSGTEAGIEIADLITSIINHANGFYYCDEKFSYIQSNVEMAILSLMMSCLGDNEQLFFTSHNLDILEINLPKHSFNFMFKACIDNNINIDYVSASNYLKKNSDSVRNAVDNDLFNIAPDLSLIYDIEDIAD